MPPEPQPLFLRKEGAAGLWAWSKTPHDRAAHVLPPEVFDRLDGHLGATPYARLYSSGTVDYRYYASEADAYAALRRARA